MESYCKINTKAPSLDLASMSWVYEVWFTFVTTVFVVERLSHLVGSLWRAVYLVQTLTKFGTFGVHFLRQVYCLMISNASRIEAWGVN